MGWHSSGLGCGEGGTRPEKLLIRYCIIEWEPGTALGGTLPVNFCLFGPVVVMGGI